MPLTKYERRVVSIASDVRLKPGQIVHMLGAEGILTTSQTVMRTLTRWKEMGSYEDRPKSGCPKTIPETYYRFIDEKMAENDELTASDLMELLVDKFGRFECSYSLRTIARVRLELGWTFSTTRYCQAIRDANKDKRVEWCKERLMEGETFDDVIFTNESTIQLDCHRRKSFRKRGAPRKLKYGHKHPPKLHVWAGISRRGATNIVMFDSIMTATRYGDILSASLVPFIKEKYPSSHRLYQDNDPKHTAATFKVFLRNTILNGGRALQRVRI